MRRYSLSVLDRYFALLADGSELHLQKKARIPNSEFNAAEGEIATVFN